MKNKKLLKNIIYNEYLKAALLPILIIEVIVLVLYFGTISYLKFKTRDTIHQEAHQNINEIASSEANNIDQKIHSISALSEILQKECSRFFKSPEGFCIPLVEPKFAVSPNGVFYQTNNNGGSSLFYSGITKIGDKERKKALETIALDPIFKEVFEVNPNLVAIYLNTYDSMSRYYPFMSDMYKVIDPNINIPGFNFYYLADEKHNPERKPIWTDTYLDPAGKGWMVSCVAPIYRENNFLEGVAGMDVTIDNIVKNILVRDLPWDAKAFLVNKNGVVLAMPEDIRKILNIKELNQDAYQSPINTDSIRPEEFNLLNNKDSKIASQFKRIFTSGIGNTDFSINNKNYILTQNIIEQTGWRLLILADKDIVYAPIYKLNNIAKQIGYAAFIFMGLFNLVFFSYLISKSRKISLKIANPIVEVAGLTSEIRTELKKDSYKYAEESDIEEVNLLVKNYNEMAEELRKYYFELELKVEQRTEELFALNEELTAINEELNNTNNDLNFEIEEREKIKKQIEKKNIELEKSNGELKNAQLQLIQQEKLASIGQLAAGVAHEINNPLGFIMSNIVVLRKYIDKMNEFLNKQQTSIDELAVLSGNSTEDAAAIQRSVSEQKKLLKIENILKDTDNLISETLEGTERIKNIVQELKSFSRVSADISISDINKGIDSVINIIWNELKYKATIKKEYGDIPMIECNQGQLNQVFMNILLNAVQAIGERGEIIIRTWKENNNVVISISDTGEGIPNEIINKIFDPFFTTKDVGKGTGLGLSVSYDIIKKHGGTIEVQSTVGIGTIFAIKIPINDQVE